MTLVPFTQCCLQLGVDPKTLRFWLKTAHLSCCLHPADARLKCLTHDQLQQVARLHDRCLPAASGSLCSVSPAQSANAPTTTADSSLSLASTQVSELRHQLTLLQAQVTTLQGQVTELALALLRGSFSQFCASASPPPPLASHAPAPSTPTQTPRALSLASPPHPPAPRACEPAPEQPRARSRAQPLIEVRADGTYIAISPTEGVLPLVPDSLEWFAWLASLTAFTFQGKLGRYSATRKFRDGERLQSWNVHRSLHGRSCTLYLGLTPTLTLAHLEDIAAAVHARLTAL